MDGEEEGCHDDSTEEEGVAVRGMESSLDRSPSHMRKNLEKPPDSVSLVQGRAGRKGGGWEAMSLCCAAACTCQYCYEL